jgi:hypothetical protein
MQEVCLQKEPQTLPYLLQNPWVPEVNREMGEPNPDRLKVYHHRLVIEQGGPTLKM